LRSSEGGEGGEWCAQTKGLFANNGIDSSYCTQTGLELNEYLVMTQVHIEKGLHSSNGNIFANGGQLLGGLIVAHIYAWDLALVTLSVR